METSKNLCPELVLDLSPEQLDTLRHMLGINTPDDREPKPYRDYYCANRDDPKLKALANAGAVRLYSQRDSYDWYCCTDAGRVAAMRSHRTIRRTKGQRIYSRFLDVSDCCPDLTFRQFLTDAEFAQIRREA